MEISRRTRNRKPIFEKKDNTVQPSMYQSTPNFYQGPAHLKQRPVDYHSRIIYGPRNTMPVHTHSVAKMNKPITITVCPPNRPQSMMGRSMPLPIHQQPYIIHNRAPSPMVRSSYSTHNLQPQVMMRPINQTETQMNRSVVHPVVESMKSSMVRRGDIRYQGNSRSC